MTNITNDEANEILGKIDLSSHYMSIPEHVEIFYYSKLGNEIKYKLRGKYATAKTLTTQHFCKVCRFDDHITMIWLLKYGDKMPENIDQL